MLIRVGGVIIFVITVTTLIKLSNRFKQSLPALHVTLLTLAPGYVKGYMHRKGFIALVKIIKARAAVCA